VDGAYVRCLMVETGQEKIVRQLLAVRQLGRSIYPQRVRIRRMHGKWKKDLVRLLPGYLFVFTDEEIPVWKYQHIEHVLKVLRYDREPQGYLHGVDLDFAKTVSELDGRLDILNAVDEDGMIRITDILMESLHGEILSVSRRKRLVKLKVDLLGQERVLYMNYQLIGGDGEPVDPVTEMIGDPEDEWLTAWTPDFAEDLAEELDAEAVRRWEEADSSEENGETPEPADAQDGEKDKGEQIR